MKRLTLTDYVNKQLQTDPEFSNHYQKEQIINNIASIYSINRNINKNCSGIKFKTSTANG